MELAPRLRVVDKVAERWPACQSVRPSATGRARPRRTNRRIYYWHITTFLLDNRTRRSSFSTSMADAITPSKLKVRGVHLPHLRCSRTSATTQALRIRGGKIGTHWNALRGRATTLVHPCVLAEVQPRRNVGLCAFPAVHVKGGE